MIPLFSLVIFYNYLSNLGLFGITNNILLRTSFNNFKVSANNINIILKTEYFKLLQQNYWKNKI